MNVLENPFALLTIGLGNCDNHIFLIAKMYYISKKRYKVQRENKTFWFKYFVFQIN